MTWQTFTEPMFCLLITKHQRWLRWWWDLTRPRHLWFPYLNFCGKLCFLFVTSTKFNTKSSPTFSQSLVSRNLFILVKEYTFSPSDPTTKRYFQGKFRVGERCFSHIVSVETHGFKLLQRWREHYFTVHIMIYSHCLKICDLATQEAWLVFVKAGKPRWH